MGFFEDNLRSRLVLAVCGLLAVLFQIVSLSTEKWIALTIPGHVISLGVFSTANAINRETRMAAAFVTIAVVASVLGLICMGLVYLTDVSLKARQRRLVSCVFWIISGVFQLSAIVCASQFLYFLGKVICETRDQCEVLFPWSILAAGFGLLFTVSSAAMTNLLMCFEQPIRRTSNVDMC